MWTTATVKADANCVSALVALLTFVGVGAGVAVGVVVGVVVVGGGSLQFGTCDVEIFLKTTIFGFVGFGDGTKM